MYQFHIHLDAVCLRKALGLHCYIFSIAIVAKLGYLGDGWYHTLVIIQNMEPTIIRKGLLDLGWRLWMPWPTLSQFV